MAVSQYHVYVIPVYSIIHSAIYLRVARDFYSNGRPLVAFATSSARVYLSYYRGVLSSSAPEIGLNWPQFEALLPFPIPLPRESDGA